MKNFALKAIYALIGCMLYSVSVQALECPKIILTEELELPLNDNELSLLCPLTSDEKRRQEIPHYQAKFYLQGFLQARGHLRPEFQTNGDSLEVTPGQKSFLRKIENQENNLDLQHETERFYQGKIVTPLLLNSIEAFAANFYRSKGHPCPKVSTTYTPESQVLSLDVTNLESKKFGTIKSDAMKSLNPQFVRRFEAFKPHQIYNPIKLELTKKRILRSRVVQSTYYQKNCAADGDDFQIKQSFIPGHPRTLRFGLGLNTEVGPMARARWTNHRYGRMGSTLQANIQATIVEQSLSLGSEFFSNSDHPRRSWPGEFELTRTSESDYNEIRSELGQKIKWTADSLNHQWTWQTGPVITASWFKTDSNKKRRSLVAPSWQFNFKVQDHRYEFFDIFPQEGHKIQISSDIRPTWIGSDFNLYQLEFRSVKLMPITQWGKGDLIAGARLNLQSTWVDETTSISSVPPALRYYGGGESNNRGQRHKSLPKNNGLGALTQGLIKLELRKTHAFIPELEFFLFTDISKFSEKPWQFDKTYWVSPGTGLRWNSPIGPIQAYVAKSLRYSPHRDDGLYFFIGLGGDL